MENESLHPKYQKYYKLLKESQDLNLQVGELNNELFQIKISFLWWISKNKLDILKNKIDNLQDIYKTWVNDLWEFYWVEITEYINTPPQKQNEKSQPYHLDLLMNTANFAEVQMNRLTGNINRDYDKCENFKSFVIAITSGVISLIGLVISLGVTIPKASYCELALFWITLIVLIGGIFFAKWIKKMNLGKTQQWILRLYSFLFLGLCFWVPWVYVDMQGHPIKRFDNYFIANVPKSLHHLIQTIDMNRLFLEIVGITIPAIILVLTFKKNMDTTKEKN